MQSWVNRGEEIVVPRSSGSNVQATATPIWSRGVVIAARPAQAKTRAHNITLSAGKAIGVESAGGRRRQTNAK